MMAEAEYTTRRGPQIRARLVTVALDNPYDEFEVTVWANAPTGLWMQVMGSEDVDEAERLAALARLVQAHNGWIDYDGEPYPPADSAAFWEAIPTELAIATLVAARRVASRPDFLKATRPI